MPIRDLHQLINTGTHQPWQIALTIVTGIAATIVFLILGYLGYRYLMIQKAQKATTMQGEQP